MTSNDPTGNAGRGDPADDATRADWPVGAPQDLPPAQGLPPSPGFEPARGAAAGPPPGPSSPPPPSPPAPGYAPAPGYGAGPGYPSSSTPGYGPGPAGTPAPGMAWAPPPEAYGVPESGGLAYAGAFPRFVAWIIDSLILGVIGLILAAGAFALFAGTVDWSQVLRPGSSRVNLPNSGPFAGGILVASVIAALIGLAYFVLLWTSGARATLGMRVLRLQVANAADGATLTKGQAVRRWIALGTWLSLLSYVPVVGALSGLAQVVWYLALLGTTITSATKQGIHDRFAGSVVVQPRAGSENGLIIGCLVIIAFLVILPIIAIIALAFLGGQISDILRSVGESV